MNEPAISLVEQSFHIAWNKLIKELGKIEMPNECGDCKYSVFCSRCPGILAAECGSCNQVDEAFCENAKRLYYAFGDKKGEIDEEGICRT